MIRGLAVAAGSRRLYNFERRKNYMSMIRHNAESIKTIFFAVMKMEIVSNQTRNLVR
jgi:hypothetical protein